MYLLECWKESLGAFKPKRFYYFFNKFILSYSRSTKMFLKYFSWLFFVDSALFFLSGSLCSKFTVFFSSPLKNFSLFAFILYFLMVVSWFSLKASYFILIMFSSKGFNLHAFKISFRRYFEIVLIFTVLIFILFSILFFIGITKIPNLNWIILLIIKFIEIVTLFFWLDSRYKVNDIFISIEKSINFVYYNAPFFIILIFASLGFGYLTKSLFSIFFSSIRLDITLSTVGQISKLLTTSDSFDFVLYLKFIFVKFSKLILIGFIISLVYSFYSFKKHNKYSDSYFN